MDFSFTQEELDLRKEIEEFVKGELPSDWDEQIVWWPGSYGTLPRMEAEFQEITKHFNRMLGEKGWLTLSWPEEYGGQDSHMKAAIAADVFSYYRVPAGGTGLNICAPTLILVGSEELKKEFLPPIAAGEIGFWLAYSEPNAGSDLVSLRTSAVDDGDDFIVNGQKIWSSGAHYADWAVLLARTDPHVPKHRGLSYLLMDMHSPGVTVRPLRQITGFQDFNQVFLDNVRIPKHQILGEKNRGFYILASVLEYERRTLLEF